jgi:hypothetical protein
MPGMGKRIFTGFALVEVNHNHPPGGARLQLGAW